MSVEKSIVGNAPNEIPMREESREAVGLKRTVHGGVRWAPSAKTDGLHQPQDGAQEPGTLLTAQSRMALREPEDASLTGGTRSLMRRVMGLNVTALATTTRKALPRPIAAKSQAQVA